MISWRDRNNESCYSFYSIFLFNCSTILVILTINKKKMIINLGFFFFTLLFVWRREDEEKRIFEKCKTEKQ